MKIVLAGGSGQVGQILARAFLGRGNEVVILARTAVAAHGRTIPWDGKSLGPWCAELDGADVVVNLAGRSVNCRYNATNRREILESRVDSAHIVATAIAQSRRPPPVWLQASTATIYSHRFDSPNDELHGILGGNEPDAPANWRFSIEVAKAWESAAQSVRTPNTRLVLLRSALTLSPDRGGIFDVLVGLTRRGLGGRSGSGRQMVSWIHEHDFVRAVDFLIAHEEFSGPVNLSSPNPLPNAEFMRALRSACGVVVGLPAPRWLLEIGAAVLGTETELLLKSRFVTPGRLLSAGFDFEFPAWQEAAAELWDRWRASSTRHIH